MESLKPGRKTLFVLLWGVLGWGASTASLITIFDGLTTHHLGTFTVLGRFVIFMSLGVIMGELMWNRREALAHKKTTRSSNIVRGVLFVAMMLGLIFVLFRMVSR
jgi:uncharacterized membrane protein YidH (DUF202 family)